MWFFLTILESEGISELDLVDLSLYASWIVSSVKAGHGVQNLLDGSLETFWQSDSSLPHTITVLFPELVLVRELELYLDYSLDESYTPMDISVKVGCQRSEFFDVRSIELDRPNGWISIPFCNTEEGVIPVHTIQICFLSNCQDGKDSRVRLAKILGHQT